MVLRTVLLQTLVAKACLHHVAAYAPPGDDMPVAADSREDPGAEDLVPRGTCFLAFHRTIR